jgi:PAS domain S-box-containing protein
MVFIDSSHDWGLWLSPGGAPVYCTPSSERITGYLPQEIVADPGLLCSMVTAEDRERVAQHLRVDERDPWEPYHVDYRILTKAGEQRWISHYCRPMRSAGGVLLGRSADNRDITARKGTEEELRRQTTLARTLLDAFPHAALLIRPRSREVVACNQAARTQGAVEGEACHRSLGGRTDPCPWCRAPALWETGTAQSEEVRGRDSTHMLHWVPVSTDLYMQYSYDVTRQWAMEAKLAQAQKMESIGRIAGGIAHEINNPNQAISANLRLLGEVWRDMEPVVARYVGERGDFVAGGMGSEDVIPEVGRLIANASEASAHIGQIVGDLKSYVGQEAGAEFAAVDVNLVAKAAARLLDGRIRRATSRFTLDLAPRLPPVHGNFRRLEQVLVNLIENACDALPDRERGIAVATTPDSASGMVVLTVADEGRGMTAEDLAHIKDLFFTTKRETGGTGLGIPIADSIVGEHGGLLAFSLREGGGMVVTVTLPASHGIPS